MLDPRKKQKQQEKKKAKERKAKEKEAMERSRNTLAAQLERAAKAPIHFCGVSETLWDAGMGYVYFSRSLPNGMMAQTMILLDTYCLGIKDVECSIRSRMEYEDFHNRVVGTGVLPQAPSYVGKLLKDIEAYAHNLHFDPPVEYRLARILLGDLHPESCTEEFTFGLKGKPHFMAGPKDNATRCTQILTSLLNQLGPNGFNFTITEKISSQLPTKLLQAWGTVIDEEPLTGNQDFGDEEDFGAAGEFGDEMEVDDDIQDEPGDDENK